MTIANAPLLVPSTDRIAAELLRARAIEEGDRRWRREARRLATYCGLFHGVGLFIGWVSFHLTGDQAQIAFWGGLLLGNSSILLYLLVMWARAES